MVLSVRRQETGGDMPIAAKGFSARKFPPFERQTKSGSRLIFPCNGLLGVHSSIGHWVVPPFVVLRLGPSVSYRVHHVDNITFHDIAIPSELNHKLPNSYGLYHMTPLLRELLLTFEDNSRLLHGDSRSKLVLELLQTMQRWDSCTVYCQELIQPQDIRVARICEYIRQNLDSDKKLVEWAEEYRLDPRTLHRLFVNEFGISFMQWRQQIRVMAALKWLREGRPVIDIALELGYRSQSAFTAMFRRNVGITPTAWQENCEAMMD